MLPSLDFTDVSTPGIYLMECGIYTFSLDHDRHGEWYIPTIWLGNCCIIRRKCIIDSTTNPFNAI